MAPALGADGPELVVSGSLEIEGPGSDDDSAELEPGELDADVLGETVDGEGFTLDTGSAVEDEVEGALTDELGDVLTPPVVGATEVGPTELEGVVAVTLAVGAGVPSLVDPLSLHAAAHRTKPNAHTG
jgi:hypothetical protein